MRSTSIDAWRGYLESVAGHAAEQARRELPVVTISREALAGATPVAERLAEQLNQQTPAREGVPPWTVFDRNLVERVLEDHELPKALQRFMPEDAAIFSPVKCVEEMLGLHPSEWTLTHHTTDTIFRLARMGNVILIGRGSSVIASGAGKAFHVRLVAPGKMRIKRAAELYQLTEREAAVYVREKDAARRRYVRRHFHVAIDDPLQYHAILNTGLLGFEAAARLIADAVLYPGRR
jgi:cytidylate kinase